MTKIKSWNGGAGDTLVLVSVQRFKELRITENEDGTICECETLAKESKDRGSKVDPDRGPKNHHPQKLSEGTAVNRLQLITTTESNMVHPMFLRILHRALISPWF